MRKLIDRIAHRLGYVRWDHTIQGGIEWKLGEQTYVDLKVPGGQRVCGWVDNRLPVLTYGDGYSAEELFGLQSLGPNDSNMQPPRLDDGPRAG